MNKKAAELSREASQNSIQVVHQHSSFHIASEPPVNSFLECTLDNRTNPKLIATQSLRTSKS